MGHRLGLSILILIIAVALVRIALLLIQIKRRIGRTKQEYTSKRAELLSAMVDDVLVHSESSFPEFGRILRAVLKKCAPDELLSQHELSDGFTRLSILIEKGKRATAGKSAIARADVELSPEDSREAKATMVRIVRALRDVESLNQSLGYDFKKLVDDFLDVMSGGKASGKKALHNLAGENKGSFP